MHLAYDTCRGEKHTEVDFQVLKGPDAEAPYQFTQNRVTSSLALTRPR